MTDYLRETETGEKKKTAEYTRTFAQNFRGISSRAYLMIGTY